MDIKNKYRIISELGRGGMGVVYHARDIQLGRDCALKVLHNVTPESWQRFFVEAQSVAKLNHKNIIKMYEIDVYKQQPYFIMEYIPGICLSDWIAENRSDIPLCLSIFAQICSGIVCAHDNKIIHRDLKPHNILVMENDTPVILDFGIAKDTEGNVDLTKTGDLYGTPKYLAPEIVQGMTVDARCDVYALGVILYELLTGRVPFDGSNVMEVMFQLATEEPILPSLLNKSIAKDSDLEIVCMKALEKNPEKRLASAHILYQEVQAIITGKPIMTQSPKFSEKWLKKFKYDRLFRYSMIFSFLGSICIFGIVVLFGHRELQALEQEKSQVKKSVVKLEQEKSQVKKAVVKLEQEKLAANHAVVDTLLQELENIMHSDRSSVAAIPLLKKWKSSYEKIADITQKTQQIPTESYQRFLKTLSFLKFFIVPTLPKEIAKERFSFADDKKIRLAHNNRYHAIYNYQQTEIFDQARRKIYDGKHSFETFSANSNYFYYLSPGGIDIHALPSCKKIIRLKHFSKTIQHKLSPNSQIFAYSNADYEIEIIRLKSLKRVQVPIKEKVRRFLFSPDSKWLLVISTRSMYFVNVHSGKVQGFEKRFSNWNVGANFLSHERSLYLYFRNCFSDVSMYRLKQGKWREKNYPNSYHFRTESYANLELVQISPENDSLAFAREKTVFYAYIESMLKSSSTVKPSEYFITKHPQKITKVRFLNQKWLASESKHELQIADVSSEKKLSLAGLGNFHQYDSGILQTISTYEEKKEKTCILRTLQLYPSLMKTVRPTKLDPGIFKKFSKGYEGVEEDSMKAFATNDLSCIFVPTRWVILMWYKQKQGYADRIDMIAPFFSVQKKRLSDDEQYLAILLKGNMSRSFKLRVYDLHQQSERNFKEFKLNFMGKFTSIRGLEITNDNRRIRICEDEKVWEILWKEYEDNSTLSLENLPRFVTLENEVYNLKSRKDLTAVTHQYSSLSLFQNRERVYKLQHKHNMPIELMAWANLQNTLAFVSNDRIFILKKTRQQWQCTPLVADKIWQETWDDTITEIAFSPKDEYLAIFGKEKFFIYDFHSKCLTPSHLGTYNMNGASYTRNWQTAICASNKEVAIFDLTKQTFSQHESYFKVEGGYWPQQVANTLKKYLVKDK
ncbi:serine/threonine protein kinase [Candidatus Uabimicrobium amorphum]|uniref:Serine/threonine protein kinase n=1 Tax=Uabimicrobium amorphum TaxID=2596890 RepID=A0A5S9IJN5_UABAM|nr:serine/threonine-protein kinase [Candidatus Uabimicrobium amorphum]BBM82767.1 serine/threonine protein kinase [Candidatus Uabimicrobium amorphum]